MKKPKKITVSQNKYLSDLKSGISTDIAVQAYTARSIHYKTMKSRAKALNIINKSYKFKTTTIKRGDTTYTKRTALKVSKKEIESYFLTLKENEVLNNSNIKSKAAFVRAFKKSSVTNQIFLKNLSLTTKIAGEEREALERGTAGGDGSDGYVQKGPLLANKLSIKTKSKLTGYRRIESLVTKHTGKTIALIENKGKLNVHAAQDEAEYRTKYWKLVDKSSEEFKRTVKYMEYLQKKRKVGGKLDRMIKQMQKTKNFKDQELGNMRWVPIVNIRDENFMHEISVKNPTVGEKIDAKKVLFFETAEQMVNVKKALLQTKIKKAKGKEKKLLKEQLAKQIYTPEGDKLVREINALKKARIRTDLLEDIDYKSFTKRWIDEDGIEHIDTSDWTAYWARRHAQDLNNKKIGHYSFHSQTAHDPETE